MAQLPEPQTNVPGYSIIEGGILTPTLPRVGILIAGISLPLQVALMNAEIVSKPVYLLL